MRRGYGSRSEVERGSMGKRQGTQILPPGFWAPIITGNKIYRAGNPSLEGYGVGQNVITLRVITLTLTVITIWHIDRL